MSRQMIQDVVQQELDQKRFPGAVLICGSEKEIYFRESFGCSRIVPASVPMQTDMMFDVASVTKAVATVTALAICADDGLVHFEETVEKYLPDFSGPHKSGITVAQLAYHASGMDNTKFNDLSGDSFFKAVLTAPIQELPGKQFSYSCRNYVLLGLIIEAVSGQALDVFCAERIFKPLGMNSTGFVPPNDLSCLVSTERKTPGEVSDNQARCAGRPIGNAGLFTSADDLSLFAQMMLGQGQKSDVKIYSREIHQAVTTKVTPDHLPARGIGWDMRPVEELPARGRLLSPAGYGHTGWTGQSLWMDPQRDFFAVILTNRTHPRWNDDDDEAAVSRGRFMDALIESFSGEMKGDC